MPISAAAVRLLDPAGEVTAAATSGDAGQFTLDVDRIGAYSIGVERLGYQPIEETLEIEEGDELELEIRLAADAVALDPVVVVARRRSEWGRLRRFRERAEWVRNFGGGRIYMGEEIQQMRLSSVESLIDMHPWGIRCEPTILLNGIRTDGSIFGVTPEQLIGIELYRGGNQIPVEYYQPGMCGMALLWTHNDSEGRSWSWVRLGVAGAIVLVVGFLLR